MADRFPLIIDSAEEKIKELVSGDNLDLTGNSIKNADYIQTAEANIAGIVTATKFKGDGSELDNLPAGGSSLEATASGTLADGDTTIINTDGTVSAVAQVGSGWIASLGGISTEYGHGVTHDSSGNVYLAGYTGSSGQGSNEILVAKYNSSGTIQWQRTLGDTSTDKGYSIALDSSDNIYVVGPSYNASIGKYDGLIVKYNNSGDLQWQRRLSSSNTDILSGVGVDSSDNIYVSGRTNGAGQGSYDFLIAKYNSSGTIQWQRTLGGSNNDIDEENTIEVDSSGNVYVGGYTNSSGGNGQSNMLLAKYNSSGTLQWQVYQGAVGFKGIEGIALDDSGNVYVVGQSQENPSWSYYSLFVVKYNSSGSFQWQRRLHDDSANTTQGRGITVDSSDNVYVAGYTNAGPGAIIAKYNSSGTIQWQRYLTRSSSTGAAEAYDLSVDGSDNLYIAGYSSIVSAGGYDAFIAKLPTDGSGMGTYGDYLYTEGTLTETATSYSGEGPASLTSATSSLTPATSNLIPATSNLTSNITNMASTNLTSENFIGISDGAYSDGQTATIQLTGAVDDAQSSLTPGQAYYVQDDGTLGESGSVFAGTAVAATKLIVKG